MIQLVQNMAPVMEPIPILLVTIKQAAQALNVGENTVLYLIASGKLPSVKVGGMQRRLFSDDIEALNLAEIVKIDRALNHQ